MVEELGPNQEPKRFKKPMGELAVVNPQLLNIVIQTDVVKNLIETKALLNSTSLARIGNIPDSNYVILYL